jgi:hypothetical protein
MGAWFSLIGNSSKAHHKLPIHFVEFSSCGKMACEGLCPAKVNHEYGQFNSIKQTYIE